MARKVPILLLVIPWSLVIAEIDYAVKKKKRRRIKRLERERQVLDRVEHQRRTS